MQRVTIGHYEVHEELGRGLFGVTCLGVHRHVAGQQVALKIAQPALAGEPAFRAALERTSFALRSLLHPGVASFLTVSAGAERLAVVREFVAGTALPALLARGRPPVDAAIRLLEQALPALAGVHAFGLAHGDLKPSDLFVCTDGRVCLTDPCLGALARNALTGEQGLPPAPLGYLAPEGTLAAGPRADLYALGLIGWEVLVGHAACPTGDPVAMLGWHRYQGLTDPRHERPDCPPWLAAVLLQLSALDPGRRPADAARALEALQQTRTAAPTSVLVTPPAPWRALPAPPPAPGVRNEDPTLPHTFEAAPPAREAPTLPHLPDLPPAAGPGFGAAAPFDFGTAAPLVPPGPPSATPPAEPDVPRAPPPAPATSRAHRLGPAPAPVLVPDPEAKRREAIKVAAFWSITVGALLVSVISFGGYRAMEARRLAAARDLGTEVDPDLLLGGYAERAERGEAPPEAGSTPARPRGLRPIPEPTPQPAAPAPTGVPTALPPGEAGNLSLSSNPIGARIWLDNVEIGHTPLEGYAVAPGHHVVRVELDGYQWASRTLEAASGAAVDLGSIPMERVVAGAGPVRLWSAGLTGATVFVDGRHLGRLPVQTELTPGPHTFFVQPDGGEPVERVLEVRPGFEGAPFEVDLEAP